jgi:hypothetical protein
MSNLKSRIQRLDKHLHGECARCKADSSNRVKISVWMEGTPEPVFPAPGAARACPRCGRAIEYHHTIIELHPRPAPKVSYESEIPA